jgi:hypothetical protein
MQLDTCIRWSVEGAGQAGSEIELAFVDTDFAQFERFYAEQEIRGLLAAFFVPTI